MTCVLIISYFQIVTIFCSDRVSNSKSRGGGVLITVSSRVFPVNTDDSFMRNVFGLKFPFIMTVVYSSVIIPQDIKLGIITKSLATKDHSILLTENFSVPNFVWERGVSLPKCYFYSKLE
jgi:hypothetical protein